jgi:hypothetical protein
MASSNHRGPNQRKIKKRRPRSTVTACSPSAPIRKGEDIVEYKGR